MPNSTSATLIKITLETGPPHKNCRFAFSAPQVEYWTFYPPVTVQMYSHFWYDIFTIVINFSKSQSSRFVVLAYTKLLTMFCLIEVRICSRKANFTDFWPKCLKRSTIVETRSRYFRNQCSGKVETSRIVDQPNIMGRFFAQTCVWLAAFRAVIVVTVISTAV